MKIPTECSIDWDSLIPEKDWAVYRHLIEAAHEERIPFAIGGGLAFSEYAKQARFTKDVDLFVMPQHRERMIELVTGSGFHDLFDTEAYERHWIYRGHQGDLIVDVMWMMANRRAEFDERWVSGGPEVEIRGTTVRLIPPEELVWAKLYVFHRERCDWPDLLNVLYQRADDLDLDHLRRRLGDDQPLLDGLLAMFQWMCPNGLLDEQRMRYLDTREWFGPKASPDH